MKINFSYAKHKKKNKKGKMAELPSFSQLFTDRITLEDVNTFYTKKDLEKLRDLCLAYNNLPPEEEEEEEEEERRQRNLIEIEEIRNDKIAMILALWMHDVDIPDYLNLTWGEPYAKHSLA